MDWKRVKSILIALLLVTNLLLGFNIYSHYMEQRLRENESLEEAIGLMSQQGRGITFDMAKDLPASMNHYQFQRDVEGEEAFARHLLGDEVISQVHGGGVYEYNSPMGTVRFSRGGIKLDISLSPVDSDLNVCLDRLAAAGIEVNGFSNLSSQGTWGSISQQLEGYPVDNSMLEMSLANGVLSVTGQWIISTLSTATPLTFTRAELLLALDRAMIALEMSSSVQVLSIYPGYLAENTDGRDIFLEPVWIAETTHGKLALHLRNKTLTPLS